VFAVKTDKKTDLDYLEELLRENLKYTKHEVKSSHGSWIDSWAGVQGQNIYIKMDDDIVCLSERQYITDFILLTVTGFH
jgi:hypothetical protein